MSITVAGLIKYEETHEFKSEPLIIRKGMTITDRKKYFNSNLATVLGNRGNRTFKPYYDRFSRVYKHSKKGVEYGVRARGTKKRRNKSIK